MDGKKKNKKKKNKQNKTTDVSTSSNAQKISKDNNDIPEQNQQNQPMETQGVIPLNQSSGAEEDHQKHDRPDGANSNLESQKEHMERLLLDKQLQIHKEADLHEKVKKLQEENDHLHKKEVDLEMKVAELQEEREAWHQKEIALEKNIGQLMQEKAVLCSMEEKVKALEEERVSGIRKEISSRETISSMNDDISKLQVQVTELEETKRNLSVKNQQLVDKLSTLQSTAQASADSIPKGDDGSQVENLNAEIESACALIEKLVSENAELVEKVNELYMELNRLDLEASRQDASSSVLIPNSLAGNTDITSSSGINGKGVSSQSVQEKDWSLFNGDKTRREHSVTEIQESSETNAGGEIVQIPLDENDALDLEGQALIQQEVEAVSLTDAPLIGAPFRLISFFASYVSGADLVDKDSNPEP